MNWKILTLFTLYLTYALPVKCQVAQNTYWVQFTDKKGTPYSLDKPEEFISQRSVDRRLKQEIKPDSTDLPVNLAYVDSLRSLGLYVHNTSKWLNGAVVLSSDELLIDTLHYLSFVANPLRSKDEQSVSSLQPDKFPAKEKSAIDYGYSDTQVKMLRGESLHQMGFTGEGMLISVLDAGFSGVDELESLLHLWDKNQIIAWKDFVKDGMEFFNTHHHGTVVLSLMAGVIPDIIYGSAPDASYILVRTEDVFSEYPVEEYNWLAGAEYADSLGTDIINSSLGYSLFDESKYNYSYEDLDGKTTIISFGALLAARKGILVSTSAGNSGNNPNWGYITAPADADSIITVGAVDSLRQIASFSGRGTTYDGRVKPDVCAQGVNAYGQVTSGQLRYCTGTSCSSPILAGMAACLWQANRNNSAQQVRKAILSSSHIYEKPDTEYGYGIPDFTLANLILKGNTSAQSDFTNIIIAPNPISDVSIININLPWIKSIKTGSIDLFSLEGRLITNYKQEFAPGYNSMELLLPANLERGHYILRLTIDGRDFKAPIVKI